MAVLTLPVPPRTSRLVRYGPALNALGIGILGVLVAGFCWEWRFADSFSLPDALGASACVWLLAAIASFLQERRGGRIAAALAASSPLLLISACRSDGTAGSGALALLTVLLAAYTRWGIWRELVGPLFLTLSVLALREPALALALAPLTLWASARRPLWLTLASLGTLLLAGWVLGRMPPPLVLEKLESGEWGRRLLLVLFGLPLGLPFLLASLPTLSRRLALTRDERIHFLLLVLLPGAALLALGAPKEGLTLLLGLLVALAVAFVLGESGERWPEVATVALILGSVALLVWPLPSHRVEEGWPSLTSLRTEARRWQASRRAVVATAAPESTLVLVLPEEQKRVRNLLPGYRTLPLTERPRSIALDRASTLLLVGHRLDTQRDVLGLQLRDRATGQIRRLASFIPVAAGELPGTDGDVWWLEVSPRMRLRLGPEILLSR
jgi:hypothetical protein